MLELPETPSTTAAQEDLNHITNFQTTEPMVTEPIVSKRKDKTPYSGRNVVQMNQ